LIDLYSGILYVYGMKARGDEINQGVRKALTEIREVADWGK